MSPADDDLRSYLIAVLKADGPSAAARRLELRENWRRSQGRALAPPIDVADETSESTCEERAEEWSKLQAAWDSFSVSTIETAQAELAPLLDSSWADVRETAEWLLTIQRNRAKIIGLWPPSLERSLRDWFFAILIRPIGRGQTLRREFIAELNYSSERLHGFRQFVRRLRRALPELEQIQPGRLAELTDGVPSTVALQSRSDDGARPWKWFFVFLGIVLASLLRMGTTPHRQSLSLPSAEALRLVQSYNKENARANDLFRRRLEADLSAAAKWAGEVIQETEPLQSADAPADALHPAKPSTPSVNENRQRILKSLDAILDRQRTRRKESQVSDEVKDLNFPVTPMPQNHSKGAP